MNTTVNRIAFTAAAVSTTFISGTLFAADKLSIRDLATDKAMLVVGADDLRGTIDRLGSTAYGKLWADPSLAEEVKKIKDAFEQDMKAAAADVGIERDSVTWPASLGLAITLEVDEELGLPTPQFVFFSDWASDAEATVKMVDALVARMEKSAKDEGEAPKVEEVRGRRALVISLKNKDKDGKAEGAGDAEGGMEDDEFGGGPLSDFAASEIVVTSDKGRMIGASSVAALDALLARVDGDRTKPVGESETFKGATALSGGTQDVYAVFSTEAAAPIADAMPQLMLVRPLIARFFGDIKAWSFGFHAKEGVFETAQGIYVPGPKVGLLALADLATEAKAPPSIVPAEAISYGRLNVRFDKIVATLDDAIGGLPPEQGDMIKPQLDLYRPAMQAAFGAMGPDVHLWSLEKSAEDADSGGTVTAIAMKNDKDSARAVSDFINLLPLGLQSRDFNGMTILSDEFSPFAVGIGGGYVVLGAPKQVEQSLRSIDAKGDSGLAADAQFKQGFSHLPKSPLVGMAWWNTAKQMASQFAMVQDTFARVGVPADVEDAGDVPGFGGALKGISGLSTLLKPEVLQRCMGDSTLEFSATDKGFSTLYRTYPAAAK